MNESTVMNIGQLICHLLLNSEHSNEKIATIVQQQFQSETKVASVNWYATKLRKEGKLEGKRKAKYKAEFTELELAVMAGNASLLK
jgi:hypothetical protein